MNIRIFFSSPGDVKMERETAKRIVDRLQTEIGETADIQPYFWEHEVMVATKDYQENIPHMDDFDIVVCILWSRLGTPLDPSRHPKPGGGGFKSGTEYEFFTAMQAHELKGTPDIFVFRNTTEPRRPSRPKEMREMVDREIDRLDNFFDTYFQDDTFFTRAINIYSTLGEFEDKLTIALRSYITGRIPLASSGIESAKKNKPTYSRQPYLGLASFDYKDAPVFFGRTAQIGEIITNFQSQELDAQTNTDHPPKHFVLILGSSGSGKSSLARAGVLPMLTNPGVIEGANEWRTAIFKPADVSADPILALVQSLDTPIGLPELFADGTTPREIADLIRTQPAGGGLLLRQALTQAGALALTKRKRELEEMHELFLSEHREEDARLLREKIENLSLPAVRIALLADQLEELFTSDLSPDALASFMEILIALANSGRVFLLATLRSDFYPRCLEFPALVDLMQGSGTYALPAPSASDIGQMIRQPAAIAGLTFEENTSSGENLDELLRDAALKDPTALPLLSYTLEQLYEQRSPEGLLTLKAYHQLGGLEGAIGSRAETIFSALPIDAQGQFDSLCKQLVTLQEGGEPTRRRAYYSTLTRTPESKTLVDALVNARLLTADQSPSGERIVSVAHEALLRHWPRLVAWVEDNRIFLNTRTRVASRLADWMEKNKAEDYLIPRGPNLSAAESILAGHLASLDPLEIEFIGKSADRIRKEDQRHLRNARLITAGAIVLCLIAVAGGILAIGAKRNAQKERNAAIVQEKLAKEAEAKAVSSEARSAYINGIERLEAGKSREGLTALGQALTIKPSHTGALARLYSEQLYSLPKPIPVRSFQANTSFRQRITGGQIGPKQYVAFITDEGKPQLFDLNELEKVPGPWDGEPDSLAPVSAVDSAFALNIREDLSLRVWNTETKQQSAILHATPGFAQLSVSMDGKYFAEALNSGDVTLYETRSGEKKYHWQQKGSPAWLADSRNSYVLCASLEELVIFDRKQKRVSARLTDPDFQILSARPALPTDLGSARHVAVVHLRKRDTFPVVDQLRFLDITKGEFIADARTLEYKAFIWDFMPSPDGTSVAVAIQGGEPMLQHITDASKDQVFKCGGYATKIAMSPDERLIVSAQPDGTVYIHEAATGKQVFDVIRHPARLEDLLLSWDGRYLLTSTSQIAMIWDLAVGPALTLPLATPEYVHQTELTDKALILKSPDNLYTYDPVSLTESVIPNPRPKDSTGWLIDEKMKTAAVYFDKGVVGFYDVSSNPPTRKPIWVSPNDEVDHWAISPDGSLLASFSKGELFIVRTSDASILSQSKTEQIAPSVIEFTPDNKTLVVMAPTAENRNDQLQLRAWDVASAKPIALEHPILYSSSMCVSPDSKWLAVSANGSAAGSEYFMYIWDFADLTKAPKSIMHTDYITTAAFNSSASLLGVSGADRKLRVWSIPECKPMADAIVDTFGQIDIFTFSPDSKAIATISTKDGKSVIRSWDWREALPVSRPFELPTLAHTIRFTPDGTRLLIIAPENQAGTSTQQIIYTREIHPPVDMVEQILPLTEASTALKIRDTVVPVPCNPSDSWDEVRKAFPDSWFLKSPALRTISPAINVDSMRWIEDSEITMDELLAALPSVGLAHASIAHWQQANLEKARKQLYKLPSGSKEYQEAADKLKETQARIDRLVTFGERNAQTDPSVCYHLAHQARASGDEVRCRIFAKKALEIDPHHENTLHLLAVSYEGESRFEKAIPLLVTLVTDHPEKVIYHYRLGLNYWSSGDKVSAEKEFFKVTDDGTIAANNLGTMNFLLGRNQEALSQFKRAAEEQKRTAKDKEFELDSLVYLIVGHYAANEKEKAIGWYKVLIEKEPKAGDLAIVQSLTITRDLVDTLVSALKLTLEKHPELAPSGSE